MVLLLIGAFALGGVLGGPGGLQTYLVDHPEALRKLYAPVTQSPWNSLIFLSFGAAFLLPRQFHMLFAENLDPRALRTASWAFPAFLLLLNLPIPVILWAGQSLGLDIDPDYYVLGVTLADGPSWLSVLAFIGGLSAASAMVIVTSLALASMSLNHLLLPASYPDPEMNLYQWILWGRRLLIALIIMGGYLVYVNLRHEQGLVQLGLISFVAVAQFLPGIAGLLYWRRATRAGFISGLIGGIAAWALVLLSPLLYSSGILRSAPDVAGWIQASGMHKWAFATFTTLGLNGLLFVTVSLLTRQDSREQAAAHACCADTYTPLEGVVAARSTREFRAGLAETLGRDMADREVSQALADLRMSPDEKRSTELRRLRDRIERNLSGLLGPQLAHMIVNRRLLLDPEAKTALADSLQHLEKRLEDSRSELRGLSAELDTLRRLHRQILQELPLGVCALDGQGRIVMWNLAAEIMTETRASELLGLRLEQLPAPWDGMLGGFARAADEHVYRLELNLAGRPRWFNLHKASYLGPEALAGDDRQAPRSGTVMLIEDMTGIGQLEAELTHHDRLASIGRLAAGMAHEIGNPVTGIASLAQNLREERDPAEIRAALGDILTQTRRIADILKALQSFSRGSLHLARKERFALCEAIQEAVHLARLTHKHRRVEILSECPGDIQLEASRQLIAQVLVNLLNNAIDASSDGQRVRLGARVEDEQVEILIQDQGDGIPEGLRQTVLEPFYTTKPTGQGTGLGLSLAYRIIEDHQGSLAIEDAPGGGTRIRVRLPLRAHHPSTEPA